MFLIFFNVAVRVALPLRSQREAIGQREEYVAAHIVRPRLVATIGINIILPLIDLS